MLIAAVPNAAWTASCTAQTGAVDFGTYDPLSGTDDTTTGYVEIRCTCTLLDCVALPYTIAIGPGASGNINAREMRRAGETSGGLGYELHRDPTRLLAWGTGLNALSAIYALALFGTWQRQTVYGRATAGQTVASGTYTDTPLVTVTY